MKLLMFSLMAVVCTSLADPTPNSGTFNPPATPMPPHRHSGPWSVVGQWQGVEQAWTDTVTISADGTFHRGTGDGGRWSLTGFQDQVMLVLSWDNWPAETVVMHRPSVFKGKTLTLRRVVSGGNSAFGPVETRTWRQGEPPVKIMPKDDGFCALSLVTGHFQGGGEVVKVYIGDDGYWYLGGQSGQEGVAAQCIVIRYRKTALAD